MMMIGVFGSTTACREQAAPSSIRTANTRTVTCRNVALARSVSPIRLFDRLQILFRFFCLIAVRSDLNDFLEIGFRVLRFSRLDGGQAAIVVAVGILRI